MLPTLTLSVAYWYWPKWDRWKQWFHPESWKKRERQQGQQPVKTLWVSQDVYLQVNFLSVIKQIGIITTSLNCKLCNWIKLEGTVLHPFRGSSSSNDAAIPSTKLFPEKLLNYTLVSASKHNCKVLRINMKMFSLLPALQSVKHKCYSMHLLQPRMISVHAFASWHWLKNLKFVLWQS